MGTNGPTIGTREELIATLTGNTVTSDRVIALNALLRDLASEFDKPNVFVIGFKDGEVTLRELLSIIEANNG